MSQEGQLLDKKSLRLVTGKSANWNELVKDCIAFANATGGRLLLGIEDGQDDPPPGQQIPPDLPDTLRRKIAERCVNVGVLPDVIIADNGGQYVSLTTPRAIAVASTTDGRYYLRIADQSKPVTGDDLLRLAAERAALLLETQITLQVPRSAAAPDKLPSTGHGMVLGLLAQHDALTARELAAVLELSSVEALQPWIKRLLEWELIQSAGRTQATRYFIDPGLLRTLNFVGDTTLKRIEPHRLLALIVEDVGRYPGSRIGDIHQRVGLEIPRSRVRRALAQLVKEGKLFQEGVRSGTRYHLP